MSHTKQSADNVMTIIITPLSFLVPDLAAIRQLLESETGGTTCPSCNMPFDKGKKRKLIDTCGHERCYSCMFRNPTCPSCARSNQNQRRPVMERYTPSPQRQEPDWQSPLRLPKPPKQPSNLAQSCPTPPHTRRRFFLSPKSLRSPFGHRARHSHDNHVPLSGEYIARTIFIFAYPWARAWFSRIYIVAQTLVTPLDTLNTLLMPYRVMLKSHSFKSCCSTSHSLSVFIVLTKTSRIRFVVNNIERQLRHARPRSPRRMYVGVP